MSGEGEMTPTLKARLAAFAAALDAMSEERFERFCASLPDDDQGGER